MRSPVNITTPIRKEGELQSASLSSAIKQLANIYKLTHPNDPEIQDMDINKPNLHAYEAAQAFLSGEPPKNPQAAALYNQWQQQAFESNDYIALALESMPEEARDPYIEKWLRESAAREREQLATLHPQPTPTQPQPSPREQQPAPPPSIAPSRTPVAPELKRPLQPHSVSLEMKHQLEVLRKLEQGVPFTNIPTADPTITSIIYEQNEESTLDIQNETKVPLKGTLSKMKDGENLKKQTLAERFAIDGYMLTILPLRANDANLASMPHIDIETYSKLSLRDINTIQTHLENTITNQRIQNPPDWLKLAQTQRGKRPMLLVILNDPQDSRQITQQMQLTHHITHTTQEAIRLSETKFKDKPAVIWQVFEVRIGGELTYQIMPTYLYDNNGKASYRPLFIAESRTRIYPYAIYISTSEHLKRLVQLTLGKNGSRYLIPEEIGVQGNNMRKSVSAYIKWLNDNKAILSPFYNAL